MCTLEAHAQVHRSAVPLKQAHGSAKAGQAGLEPAISVHNLRVRLIVLITPACAVFVQGLQADECARLSQWGLNARTLCVYPAASLPTALRPAALRNTLRQLCEVLCGSGGTQLKLGGSWPWDAELLRWHVDTIPALGQRGVVSHKPSLPVAMDDALLALAVEVCVQLLCTRMLMCSYIRHACMWSYSRQRSILFRP